MNDVNDSLNECPNCHGPADNGHDRCHPPTAYWCTKCMKTEPPNGWYAQRHDNEDGDIEYHAYGPKENFVVFEGPNAKGFAKVFMQAVNGDFHE